MSANADSLGRADVLRMKRDGWEFSGNAVRVANGWLMLAVDPRSNYTPVLLADPDDEPEKWCDDGGAKSEGAQLVLL